MNANMDIWRYMMDMKKTMNNKGYMLIEIVLAAALAFGIAAFIISLLIKFKNNQLKNTIDIKK